MEINRRLFIKGFGALAFSLGNKTPIESNQKSEKTPIYTSLKQLIDDPRSSQIETGNSKRSSDLILYCRLDMGFDRANTLVAWKDGVGILAPFGGRYHLPDLALAYDDPSSVNVVHAKKELYGAVSKVAVRRCLEKQGFRNIRDDIIRTGNTHCEIIALDTRSGIGYIFRDDRYNLRNKKPLERFSFA